MLTGYVFFACVNARIHKRSTVVHYFVKGKPGPHFGSRKTGFNVIRRVQ